MKDSIIVSPSVLASDFSQIQCSLETIKESGATWVHLDVMDGSFVPNITFGPKFIKDMRKYSDLFFDAHLMINNPQNYIKQFAEAGCQAITIHAEACTHLDSALTLIKECGCLAGVSIVPSTPVSVLENVLDKVDLVLIMSVNPGFGGQKFIDYSLDKVKQLATVRNGRNFLISIDGGIDLQTYQAVVDNGADVLVTGSAFFKSSDKKSFVEKLSRKLQ